jgi:integrase
LGEISREDVVGYVGRHARDWSPETGKAMCWSLRAFLRYLHHQELHPAPLAGCVPSIRRWKFANLSTYLSSAQVQKVLDGGDQASAMGRRDHAILMMLAKLGLRANEVATLTLDDIDWQSGEMLVRAKGRQRARIPIPVDVGAAVVAYLRHGRPKSSCRRLFLRSIAPHVSFMEQREATTITTKLAMEWATLPPDRHASWALRLSDVRGFARHVANLDPKTEVPPPGILPGLKRAKPYIYSDAEVDALLAAALALPPEDGIAPLNRCDHLDGRHRAMAILTIGIALRATSAETQGSHQKTLRPGQSSRSRKKRKASGRCHVAAVRGCKRKEP